MLIEKLIDVFINTILKVFDLFPDFGDTFVDHYLADTFDFLEKLFVFMNYFIPMHFIGVVFQWIGLFFIFLFTYYVANWIIRRIADIIP